MKSMPYAFDTIAAWTALHAARQSNSPAITDSRRSVSYGQLHENVEAIAARMCAAGVTEGSRVAVVMKNKVELLELLLACARVGAVFVPLNYRFAAREVTDVLDDAEPVLLVTDPDLRELVVEACAALSEPPEIWGLAEVNDPGDHPAAPERDAHLSETLMMLYTSGTTGRSKGVLLTHENIHWNSTNVISDWGLARGDSTLVVNPLFHSVLNIMAVPLLFLGGHVRLLEDFDPAQALQILREESVSVMFAVATAWQMLLQHPEANTESFSQLRLAASGGMAAPVSMIETFLQMGVPFVQAYGLTETAPLATTVLVDEALDTVGSIGRAIINVEVKVADDSGEPVAGSEVGEIWVRGRNVAQGYWRREKETREVFLDDGWFRTGDLATVDARGFIFIVDRKKDLIISGGENISSIEVEQALYRHPDVLEAAVVAQPSERWGETPHAYLVVRDGSTITSTELLEHCRGHIARYKCPSEFSLVPELPRTTTGKVRKEVLRQQLGDR